MKNSILVSIFIASSLFFCCDSDSDKIVLSACIQADKNIIEVGETVIISNCSSNFTSFEYSYYDSKENKQVVVKDPTFELSFSKPGEYRISLGVYDEDGDSDSATTTITVNDFTNKLILLNVQDKFESIPLGAGIDPTTGNLYYIDQFGVSFNDYAYYYRELDSDYNEISKTYLKKQTENTGLATRSILGNGDKVINTVNTFSTSYFSREITINSSNNVSVEFTGISVIYGQLNFNNNKMFFGSESLYSTEENKKINYPAIEIRDINNVVIETKTYTDLDFENSIISDMIAVEDGYIAFGGAFENNGSILNNYTPLLMFLNSDLEIKEIKTYPNSKLSTSSMLSYNDLNSSMHIEKLSSGKLVTYGVGELRIMDLDGNEIFSDYIDAYSSGALLNLGDSFVISKRGYLIKYDNSGNVIKEIYSKADITTNLILDNEKIIFVSAYQSTDSNNKTRFRPFIGAVDKDLNFIDLNN